MMPSVEYLATFGVVGVVALCSWLVGYRIGHKDPHSLVHAIGDGVVRLNSKGRVVAINESAEQIFNTESPLARSISANEIFGEFPALKDAVESQSSEGKSLQITSEIDGQTCHIDVRIFTEPDGRVVLVCRDITEQSRSQQAVDQQNEELLEYTRNVAHDLKAPLNLAKGYLDGARKGDPEAVDRVENAIDRMDQMIDDLHCLSRQDNPQLEPVRLERVAQEAWDTIETGECSLECDDDVRFLADRGKLLILFENAFKNAVQHGGDTITVGGSVQQETFYIEDNGDGLPVDEPATLFTAESTDSIMGTGLTLIKNVATNHDWEIDAMDSNSGGARFSLHNLTVQPETESEVDNSSGDTVAEIASSLNAEIES